MNFELSQEQKILQKTVRDFCAREILPKAAAWSEAGRFPHEIVAPLAGLGVLGIQIPERYGGTGMGMLDLSVAVEEIARADASVGLTVASHNLLCMDHIYLAGSEEQRYKYLPRLSNGKSLGAWCLTEPDSGSDAGAARTRAIRREGPSGAEWVLNGGKSFITQGSVAEIYVVLASTTPARKQKGLTAFILEKGMPGLRPGRLVQKMGLWASDTADVVIEEVVVPDAQRLGQVDSGFFDTGKVLDRGRIGIGAWAVGIGRAAFEAARTYAMQRIQFGKPIAEFQAIRTMLADMATELDAARLSAREPLFLRIPFTRGISRPGGLPLRRAPCRAASTRSSAHHTRRPGPRTRPAPAQVLQGHAPAHRHRASPDGRSRAGRARRAHDRARPHWAQGDPRPHARAQARGPHGALLDAHFARRGNDLRSRGHDLRWPHPQRGAAVRAAHRAPALHRGVPAPRCRPAPFPARGREDSANTGRHARRPARRYGRGRLPARRPGRQGQHHLGHAPARIA